MDINNGSRQSQAAKVLGDLTFATTALASSVDLQQLLEHADLRSDQDQVSLSSKGRAH